MFCHLFSSPERLRHKLSVSFCDPLITVVRQSGVGERIIKKDVHKPRGDGIWALHSELFKIPFQCGILVAMATDRVNFKRNLVKSYLAELKIVWFNWSLGDLLPRLLNKVELSRR